MQRFLLSMLLLCSLGALAQTPCHFHSDSVVLSPLTAAKEAVELMDVTIKNNYELQFIKKDKATFLRIVVRDNLGFGQTGDLMLICGKKQIYNKDVKLVSIDKASAYFVIELNPNYIQTIKDSGLNKLIFRNTVEFLVPKSDSDKIRQTATCFFNAVIPK